MPEEKEFTPRNYQIQLMNIALNQNSILFLPTGSGKTFIALMVLKRMCESLLRKYSDEGKITVILVNSVALIDQHAKYVKVHTTLRVGGYSGDMNLDFWPREKWYEEFDKYQVFVMTSQILLNLVRQNFLDLNKVNLLIFDECHHGVSDQPMRQLMKTFDTIKEPPRILGLTATLLNGNCKPHKVMNKVEDLELTFNSKVATVDGLDHVVGYFTNPKEEIRVFRKHHSSRLENYVIEILHSTCTIIESFKLNSDNMGIPNYEREGFVPLSKNNTWCKLVNSMKDIILHFEELGSYGGLKCIIARIIQLEKLKRSSELKEQFLLIQAVETNLLWCQSFLEAEMKTYDPCEKIMKFSSDKVLKLIEILDNYRTESDKELCGLIFVERRFTAKVLYYILDSLRMDERYSHIKCDFLVGQNCNIYTNTRENLYCSKKNKQILNTFVNKGINVLCTTNVLEEGVDIPMCSLVIKFDKPKDYRSYIQSKGRARHQTSLYYILVDQLDYISFQEKYVEFQETEQTLNEFLIGKNMLRSDPSEEEMQGKYHEEPLPSYYVDGPNSAEVNMLSAVSLLCQYCQSLPSDQYTQYEPEMYLTRDNGYRVKIYLPTVCPLTKPILGPVMMTKKNAKRAACLEACKLLHQCDELDDHLLPRKVELKEEDVSFLFRHYPTKKESKAGQKNLKRMHKKQIASCLQGQILPASDVSLYVIQLTPRFKKDESNIASSTLYDMYTSSLCYGVITPKPCPQICDFPIFVTLGTIDVSISKSSNSCFTSLTAEQFSLIKEFNVLVLGDIIQALRTFLLFDNSDDAELLLLVPFNRETNGIDINVLNNYKEVKNVFEPDLEERKNLNVTKEGYFRKIVQPWYKEHTSYVVCDVCIDKTALSDFPNEEFNSYQEYFKQKHNQSLYSPAAPLLHVKPITKNKNFFKPIGLEKRKRKQNYFEGLNEHLPAELVVRQEFPASLWIQASLLPTIISRVVFLLQLEDLRCKIANDIGISTICLKSPLELDENLLNYKAHLEKASTDLEVHISSSEESSALLSLSSKPSLIDNKDFEVKMLEVQYPWKDIDEPKDIERQIDDVTLMDIEYYENFINASLMPSEALVSTESPRRTMNLALTYHKDFIPKTIKLLLKEEYTGPDLCDMYRALTTAKANDIVNLERLETLGDSFLKYAVSIYVMMRFQTYNEGQATQLKGRIISNKNLYYLGVAKNLGGIIKNNELSIHEWLPPGFSLPSILKNTDANTGRFLFNIEIPFEEQASGILSSDTLAAINEACQEKEEMEEGILAPFYQYQYIADKTVADSVEALLGAYISACGIHGGIKFVEWMGIIPKSENLGNIFNETAPDPLLKQDSSRRDIYSLLPNWEEVERIIGYNFKNPAYLLQALTHSSYTCNRVTRSYEKLEFIGDAILDFLITCYIYETFDKLDPGQLTDLRSALVNNNTFASFLVRLDLHKFLLMFNVTLQGHIDKFVDYLVSKNYQIDDEVLILLNNDDFNMGEYVDVPKVLGDVFEALAGAVYLDSGKNLNLVWEVFYKIMWKEIELFSLNVPKNVIRRLYEYSPSWTPHFSKSVEVGNGKVMVAVNFMLNGHKKRCHGFGSNKEGAKKAASKIALRLLETTKGDQGNL